MDFLPEIPLSANNGHAELNRWATQCINSDTTELSFQLINGNRWINIGRGITYSN